MDGAEEAVAAENGIRRPRGVEVEVEEHQTHQAVEEAVEVGEALVPPVQAS